MKIIRIIEIALGVLMLLDILGSLTGIVNVGDFSEGSIIITILLFLMGIFLIYSGVKGLNRINAK